MLLALRSLWEQQSEATATFEQAPASWDAVASESYETTATYTQAAGEWSAAASETHAATATFDQAAGAWDAAAQESFDATASWTQASDWSAAVDVPFAADATFVQAPAALSGSLDIPVTGEGHGPLGFVRVVRRTPVVVPEPIPVAVLGATFVQPAASFAAIAEVNDDELALALLLVA